MEPQEQLLTSEGSADDPKYGLKLALVIVGQLFCFVYAGIIFGWAPLLDMYKSMGTWLCVSVCPISSPSSRPYCLYHLLNYSL